MESTNGEQVNINHEILDEHTQLLTAREQKLADVIEDENVDVTFDGNNDGVDGSNEKDDGWRE